MERECYEEELQPSQKMDYKPIIIIIFKAGIMTRMVEKGIIIIIKMLFCKHRVNMNHPCDARTQQSL